MNDEIKKGRKKTKPSDISERYSAVFASRLRELIKEKGITQQELSDGLGGIISRQTINKWTLGTTSPDIISAAAIADYFGVSTDYLLGRTKTKTVKKDERIVCDSLGLTEAAADNLLHFLNFESSKMTEFNYKYSMKKVINKAFSEHSFWNMFYSLYKLANVSSEFLYDREFISRNIQTMIDAADSLGITSCVLYDYMSENDNWNKVRFNNRDKIDVEKYKVFKESQVLADSFDSLRLIKEYSKEDWMAYFDIDEKTLQELKEKSKREVDALNTQKAGD